MITCLAASNAAAGGNPAADDAGFATADGTTQQTSSSATTSSGKLKWLPYRPQSRTAQSEVTQTQHLVSEDPAVTSTINAPQSAQSAFDDPFGDKKLAGSTESSPKLKNTSATLTLEPNSATASPAISQQTTPQKGLYSNAIAKNSTSLSPNNLGQSLEQSLAARGPELKEGCPSHKDLKDISQLSTDITPSTGDMPQDCPWGGDLFQPRCWSPVTFTWTAAGLCHKPLYFEEVQLERYGHMLGPWVQPFASGAHFFLTVPILPYKMGLELPNECMYTLGYYRPGSCAPYTLDPLPLSIRAALFEAGAWVGAVAIIP